MGKIPLFAKFYRFEVAVANESKTTEDYLNDIFCNDGFRENIKKRVGEEYFPYCSVISSVKNTDSITFTVDMVLCQLQVPVNPLYSRLKDVGISTVHDYLNWKLDRNLISVSGAKYFMTVD